MEHKYYAYINVTEDIIYILVTLVIIILAYRWVSWIQSSGCGIVLVGGATKMIRLTAIYCYFIALENYIVWYYLTEPTIIYRYPMNPKCDIESQRL